MKDVYFSEMASDGSSICWRFSEGFPPVSKLFHLQRTFWSSSKLIRLFFNRTSEFPLTTPGLKRVGSSVLFYRQTTIEKLLRDFYLFRTFKEYCFTKYAFNGAPYKGLISIKEEAVLSVEDPLRVFLLSLKVFYLHKIFLEKTIPSGSFSKAPTPVKNFGVSFVRETF